jgi:hypothetical protein
MCAMDVCFPERRVIVISNIEIGTRILGPSLQQQFMTTLCSDFFVMVGHTWHEV